MISTQYRPQYHEVLENHQITKFLRREFENEDLCVVYFRPTGYYGVVRWEVKPPYDQAKFRELLSIGESLDDFTAAKVKQLRKRLSLSIRSMVKELVSKAKQQEQERRELDADDADARSYLARITRTRTGHPLWQPDPVRLSFGG